MDLFFAVYKWFFFHLLKVSYIVIYLIAITESRSLQTQNFSFTLIIIEWNVDHFKSFYGVSLNHHSAKTIKRGISFPVVDLNGFKAFSGKPLKDENKGKKN